MSSANMRNAILTLRQLESFLWEAADILRGNLDASAFKDCIFRILFLKRLSDAFEEEREQGNACYLAPETSVTKSAGAQDKYTFFVPECGRWEHLQGLTLDIGVELNRVAEMIEAHNPILEGVLTSIDFNIKDKLPDKKLRELLTHFSTHRLRDSDFERADLLGCAYEYLIKQFADSAGKKGGEFYTPGEVVNLLMALLKPHAGMKIYDPAAGSGGMLIQARNHLAARGGDPQELSLSGQEMNLGTWAICKMNLFLHGVMSADIRRGDTLREPRHVENGVLMTFDRVIANPPFSLKKWGKDEADADPYRRFPYATPAKDVGDLAFVQHMIASLNTKGMMGVIMPHGVLFRESSEKVIRRGILEDDLLEAVVGLPARLFYNTNIQACLLIINKQKPAERKNKILFINAELEFEEGKHQHRLRQQDIDHIVATFDAWQEEQRYSKVVALEEIRENDYNLNIRSYADTAPPPEIFDVRGILYGGIPVREVEDEYVQESLNGFDVLTVLNRKEADYYEFKAEIKSREAIREQVGDVDPKIVTWLERWWDKYKVSLYELDAQLDAAETRMNGYLKELGYERPAS